MTPVKMKLTTLTLALLVAASFAAVAAPAAAKAPAPRLEAQVVTLSVTYQSFDEDQPWAKENPANREVSAAVVEGPLLLTVARYVQDATLVQVSKLGRADRVSAHTVHVDYEMDLALLAVDDAAFFSDLAPARVAPFVPTSGTVSSVRWRNRQFETSASRVSRVEVSESDFGFLSHLFLDVTSDLAGGGWADPVFGADGALVGMTSTQDDRTAKVIPAENLAAYLAAARVMPYRGFATLGLSWQVNRDPVLARYLGQEGAARGVVVREIPWGSFGCGALQPRDILLSIDGHAIDADGYYEHPRYGRLRFEQLAIEGHRAGDVVPVQVLRAGKVLDLSLALPSYPTSARLVPWRRAGTPPPYLVAGGFVFREFDAPYLRTWGKEWRKKAPLALLVRYDLDDAAQRPDQRRLVLLQGVLPDAYDIGYENLADMLVKEVNARPVDSLADVAEAFRHPLGGFHVVTFYPNELRGEAVLDAAHFDEATQRILAAFKIPEPMRLADEAPFDLANACTPTDVAATH